MRKTFNKNSRESWGNKDKKNTNKKVSFVKSNNINSYNKTISNNNIVKSSNNIMKSTKIKTIKTTKENLVENNNIIYGIHPVEEALNTNPRIIEKVYIKIGLSHKGLPALLAICKENKIPVTEVGGDDKMRDLVGTSYHQGLIAITRDFEYIEIDRVIEIVKDNRMNNKPNLIIIMDELTDTQNVGAIIRTAVGVDAVAVIVPKHRQAPITGVTYKASAGMVNHIPIARVANLGVAIDKLKDNHVWVAALAMNTTPSKILPLVSNIISKEKLNTELNIAFLWSLDMKGDMAIIVGNEGEGVHKHNIENSDYTLSIPMSSKLESLNASVSAALAMYEWRRQNFSTA